MGRHVFLLVCNQERVYDWADLIHLAHWCSVAAIALKHERGRSNYFGKTQRRQRVHHMIVQRRYDKSLRFHLFCCILKLIPPRQIKGDEGF
jgi:hypothetical protein